MIDHLLDRLQSHPDYHSSGLNPALTAAATYLGGELLQNHHHHHHPTTGHSSHIWRDAALAGAMAYGLHKYKHRHYQPEPPPLTERHHHQPASHPRLGSFRHKYGMSRYPINDFPELPYQQQAFPPYYYGGGMAATWPHRYQRHHYYYDPIQYSPHMIPYHQPIVYRSLY